MPTRDDLRQLEFEDNAASQLSRPRNRTSKGVSVLVGAVTMAFVGWMMWTGNKVPARAMTAADGDDFRTTQYRAPVIDTPAPARDQGRIVLTPPPAPPPPAPAPPAAPPADPAPTFPPLNPPGVVAPPPTLAQPNDDEEARRRAEEERRRLADEERQKWERLKSPMVVTDAGLTCCETSEAWIRSPTWSSGKPTRRSEMTRSPLRSNCANWLNRAERPPARDSRSLPGTPRLRS